MNILTILLALVIFGFLIFIHELGHFIVARLCGVQILEFAIGMGPRIFAVRSHKTGTYYSLRLFPIGGFVSMLGESGMEVAQGSNGMEEAEKQKEVEPTLPEGSDSFLINTTGADGSTEAAVDPETAKHAYCNQSVWKRLLISVAGPAMNVILGFLLMLGLVIAAGPNGALSTTVGGFFLNYTAEEADGFCNGDQITYVDGVQINSMDQLRQMISEDADGVFTVDVLRYNDDRSDILEVTLDDVALDDAFLDKLTVSLSAQSGLQVGDTIKKVNRTRVHTYNELSYEILNQGYQPVTLTVERNGEDVVLEQVIFPSAAESGVTFGTPDFKIYRERNFGFGTILKFSWYRSVSTVKMVYDSLFGLVNGRFGVEAVSGPVGITKTISDAAKTGIDNVIYLMTVISINLGIVNLLPFPGLDGGHILFYLIEVVRRKPMKKEVEGALNLVGLIILLTLAVIIAVKDVIAL